LTDAYWHQINREACERLEFYPRFSRETESYDYLGGMMGFPETFGSRISRWVEQNLAGASPEEIDASGEAALKVQLVIEAIITPQPEWAVSLDETERGAGGFGSTGTGGGN
jgi:hypothetical protein